VPDYETMGRAEDRIKKAIGGASALLLAGGALDSFADQPLPCVKSPESRSSPNAAHRPAGLPT
jgi:hypothetical protein